jgi:hypothetical protein
MTRGFVSYFFRGINLSSEIMHQRKKATLRTISASGEHLISFLLAGMRDAHKKLSHRVNSVSIPRFGGMSKLAGWATKNR